ncbi:heterokaryon incompatibility protein-domain-containing protein [Rhexocercosporidium sp. MPI-PUGE-AT-0058]|nr:heterokaryon incompatibility protein-domain-containing protein [Rhexocercosporidium sp. MPI-PUGE-AT-0058]
MVSKLWHQQTTEGYAHHSYKGLHESTLSGRPLCIVLRSTDFTKFLAHIKSRKRVRVFATPRRSNDSSEPSIFSIQALKFDAGAKQKLRLEAFSSKDDPATTFLQANPTAVRVTGNDIVQNIKTLTRECKLYHKNCPRYFIPPLPSRVIDIGPEVSSKSKLHISMPGQEADYCCLSYIWGGPQEILTTTLNLEAHQIVIPSFPYTIQDAISVVRSLGFRYLWVDALYIIQNDENNKAKEINQMGQYYKNATITISACKTSSVNDGFLEDRPIRHACYLPMYLPTGNGNIWLRKDLDEMHRPPWDKDRLDTRGLAFQKTVLLPRLLRYGATELIWKCHTENFKPVWPTYPFF